MGRAKLPIPDAQDPDQAASGSLVRFVHGDSIAIVYSANVVRRHLAREQKRDVIAALLRLAPERSDRQVAKDVPASHVTVEGSVETSRPVVNLTTHSNSSVRGWQDHGAGQREEVRSTGSAAG
jgi:hypothetical protein